MRVHKATRDPRPEPASIGICACGCGDPVRPGSTFAHRGCGNRTRQYASRTPTAASNPTVLFPKKPKGALSPTTADGLTWWLAPIFQQDRTAFMVEAERRHPVASLDHRPSTPRAGARGAIPGL